MSVHVVRAFIKQRELIAGTLPYQRSHALALSVFRTDGWQAFEVVKQGERVPQRRSCRCCARRARLREA